MNHIRAARVALLPLLLAAVGLASLRVIGREHGPWGPGRGEGPPFGGGPVAGTTPDLLAAVLVVVAALALVARRRHPEATLVVTTLATAGYLVIGYPYGPILLSLALAVFAIARYRPPRVATPWAVGAFVALLVHVVARGSGGDPLTGALTAASWVAVPFTIGLARHLVEEAKERARADADERLVQEERLRLAHEVHDVVGHGLAAIQMQADIALHVRDARPGQPEEALRAISAASAEALAELRATLSEIQPDPAAAHRDSHAPTPGVARLTALADRVRSAGTHVDLDVDPRAAGLPAGVDLAVYRIVQESLTNVVKHSAHPRARVAVRRTGEGVEVSVTNDDAQRTAQSGAHVPGFGIAGMRRRAELLGGSLTTGPGPQPGTFHVHATLPAPPKETR